MTPKKKIEHIKNIKQFLIESGWNEDRYGNFIKYINEKKYRMKFNSTSLRYEILVIHAATQYSEESKEWMRIRSGYYKDIAIITDENEKKILSGLKR